MALEGLVNEQGALATTALQLKNRQHADEITNDRWEVHKDITPDQWRVHELNNQFYTANYAMYAVEDGEVVVYLGRGDTNPFFQNPEATNQLLDDKKRNYRPGEEEARVIREAESTLRINLADLNLQSKEGDEWGSFVIDSSDSDKVYENEARQQVAGIIYGSTTEVQLDKQKKPHTIFQRNMQMMRGANIVVYLLNQEYVKEHAKEGQIVRAGLLYGSKDGYGFNAFVREVNFDIMLRGEPVAEDDELVEITNITKDDSGKIAAADKGDVSEIADVVDEDAADEDLTVWKKLDTAETKAAAAKHAAQEIADAAKIQAAAAKYAAQKIADVRDAYKTIRRIYRSNPDVARQEMTHDYAFGLSWLVTDCLGQVDLKQKKAGSLFKFLSGMYTKMHKIADADEIRDAYQTLRSNLDVARQEITHDLASDLSGLVTDYFVQADLKQEKGVSFMSRLMGFPPNAYDAVQTLWGRVQVYFQQRRQRGKERAIYSTVRIENQITAKVVQIIEKVVGDVKVAILNNLKVADSKVDTSKVDTPNDDEPEVETIIPANPEVANPDVADPIISTLIADNQNVANPDVADPNNLNAEDPPVGTIPVEDLNITSENTSDDQSVESSENTSDDQPVVFGDDIKTSPDGQS